MVVVVTINEEDLPFECLSLVEDKAGAGVGEMLERGLQ